MRNANLQNISLFFMIISNEFSDLRIIKIDGKQKKRLLKNNRFFYININQCYIILNAIFSFIIFSTFIPTSVLIFKAYTPSAKFEILIEVCVSSINLVLTTRPCQIIDGFISQKNLHNKLDYHGDFSV